MDNTEKVARILGGAMQVTTGPELRRKVVAETLAKMESRPMGFFRETAQDIGQTVGGIAGELGDTVSDVGEAAGASIRGEQGMLRGAFHGIGRIAGGISGAIGEGVKGLVKTILPGGAEQSVRETVGTVGEAITSVPTVKSMIDNYQTLPPERKRDVDALLGISSLAADLAGMGAVKRASAALAPTVKTAAGKTVAGVKSAASKVGEAVSPTPTPSRAITSVIGGKATQRNLREAGRAFAATPGVSKSKSFRSVGEAFLAREKELIKSVDTEMAKVTTPVRLSKLGSTVVSGGKRISENYVRKAINQLGEMYKKTGDAPGRIKIAALAEKAKKSGLTPSEINQLARDYGTEFGSKAFGKTGEALTSVNAQMFENTRKGLKEVARGFLKTDAAKQADRTLSAVINTRKLVEKQAQLTAQALGKFEDMGLLQRLGAKLTGLVDSTRSVFQRGNLTGVVTGGGKRTSMGVLDLEESLTKNLKIIERALKLDDPKAVEKLIDSLELPTTAD
jgi:hypothetical protein